MIKRKSSGHLPSVSEASRAVRMAVRKLIVERKQKNGFLAVWRNGKVLKIPARKLKS